MSDTIEKPIDIEKKLTVDWQSTPLVQTANSICGFFQQQTCKDMLKDNWRLPWDELDYEHLYKMNYHITINPDPQCEWITSVNDLKTHNIKFREFITDLNNNKLYKNIISVYEYGKNGRQYGKVHYHILFETYKINKIIEMAISYFGTKSISRWRNTVVKKPITIDKTVSVNASDIEKVENYRSQIDFIIKYMKKESHNRMKCLYSNMKKK